MQAVVKGLSGGGFDFGNPRGILNKSTNRTTPPPSVVLVSRHSLLRLRFTSVSIKSSATSSHSFFPSSAKSRLVKAQASGLNFYSVFSFIRLYLPNLSVISLQDIVDIGITVT